MRFSFHTLFALVAVTLTSYPALATTDSASIGHVQQVEHEVEADYFGATRGIKPASSIFYDDLVKTYEKARFKASLDDGTEITLGENASLRIDDFVYDPKGETGRLSMNVITGAFLFVGGQVEAIPGNRVTIQTPVGTLGIRGTTVWGGKIDDGYGVLVLDGEVDVQTEGGSVTLTAGQATMIKDRSSTPMAPHVWSDEKTARAVATISFSDK